MPQIYKLKVVCPTHGSGTIPEKCQYIKQWKHYICGGESSMIMDNGNLICSKCNINQHISNFEFFCAGDDQFKPFTMLQGPTVKNLYNQMIGNIDDEKEQDILRQLFKKIWTK